MISNIIGLSPELTFFLLLTTTSLSLWFAASVVENSLESFFHKFILFSCSFISAFIVTSISIYSSINFFCWSITIL